MGQKLQEKLDTRESKLNQLENEHKVMTKMQEGSGAFFDFHPTKQGKKNALEVGELDKERQKLASIVGIMRTKPDSAEAHTRTVFDIWRNRSAGNQAAAIAAEEKLAAEAKAWRQKHGEMDAVVYDTAYTSAAADAASKRSSFTGWTAVATKIVDS